MMKCKFCGTENGITMYIGKKCKRCGKYLIPPKITTEFYKQEVEDDE